MCEGELGVKPICSLLPVCPCFPLVVCVLFCVFTTCSILLYRRSLLVSPFALRMLCSVDSKSHQAAMPGSASSWYAPLLWVAPFALCTTSGGVPSMCDFSGRTAHGLALVWDSNPRQNFTHIILLG